MKGFDNMTPHNEAKKGEIAETVIMPGDPLRAQYIAEKFLKDYKLVNKIRNMYAYTGYYEGTKITVMASGMGIPSMGIYAYELYKFYDVQNIIRIGSCGGYAENLKMYDIILSEEVYSESNFALEFNNENCHQVKSSEKLNEIIESIDKNIIKGKTLCMEAFDAYMENSKEMFKRIPIKPIASEMEAFALFYLANYFNKNASCLMTVVDLPFKNESINPEERQNNLNKMIEIALKAATEIKR